MNQELQDFARERLKEMLAQLGDGERRIFKLMYARASGARSTEAAEAMPIEDVVDRMEPSRLDWAMQQCLNTLRKRAALAPTNTPAASGGRDGGE